MGRSGQIEVQDHFDPEFDTSVCTLGIQDSQLSEQKNTPLRLSVTCELAWTRRFRACTMTVIGASAGDACAGSGTWRTLWCKNWVCRAETVEAFGPHSAQIQRANQCEDCPLVGELVSARTGAACSQPASSPGRAGVLRGLLGGREGTGLGFPPPLSHYVSRQRQPIAFPVTSPSAPHELTFDHRFHPSTVPRPVPSASSE